MLESTDEIQGLWEGYTQMQFCFSACECCPLQSQLLSIHHFALYIVLKYKDPDLVTYIRLCITIHQEDMIKVKYKKYLAKNYCINYITQWGEGTALQIL